MSTLTYDTKKNRLYVRLKGPIAGELKFVQSEIERIFPLIRPNFTSLTDLRSCRQFSQSDNPLIKAIQHRLWKLGLAMAVRVVADLETSTSRAEDLNLAHGGYSAEFVTSVEAGEDLLDRYSMRVHEQNSRREMYTLVDMDGWEGDQMLESFTDAERGLRDIRRNGRTNAIIVNANVKIRHKKRVA